MNTIKTILRHTLFKLQKSEDKDNLERRRNGENTYLQRNKVSIITDVLSEAIVSKKKVK